MYSTQFMKSTSQEIRDIDRIEVLVLLDLIGAPNMKFFNIFPETQQIFKRLIDVERYLYEIQAMSSNKYMFIPQNRALQIDDDHKPFYDKGNIFN